MFNFEKHYIGNICPHGHAYKDTNGSVRYVSDNRCVCCKRKYGFNYRRRPDIKTKLINKRAGTENKEYMKKYYTSKKLMDNPDYKNMYENKECTQYLGIVIGEEIINDIFDDIEKMPHGNNGYDFICAKKYKIDVKSSSLSDRNSWSFSIKKNITADFFILIAFDDIYNLSPMHLWIIHREDIVNGTMMCEKGTIRITNRSKSLSQYDRYARQDILDKIDTARYH